MPYDKIENFKGSIIQHGHHNDRVYLMQSNKLPSAKFPYELVDLAYTNKYSKIFIKIPANAATLFFNAGFLAEAIIPGFFSGKETAVFMGFYLNDERSRETCIDKIENTLKTALAKKTEAKASCLENRFILRKCNKTDVSVMAKIYREVFPSYPFPIHNPDYLLKTMLSNINYFCIEKDGELAAISSAEVNEEDANVEMTDFATLPGWRGNDFGQYLLAGMENDIKKKNIKTAYTIARALSPGMNITFSKAGYQFGGRLKNNTNISGKIESMNVWYKPIIG